MGMKLDISRTMESAEGVYTTTFSIKSSSGTKIKLKSYEHTKYTTSCVDVIDNYLKTLGVSTNNKLISYELLNKVMNTMAEVDEIDNDSEDK